MSDSQLPIPSSSSPAKPWVRRPGFWILLLALAGGAWWLTHSSSSIGVGRSAGPGKSGAFNKNRPMPVQVAAARQGDVGVYLSGLGTVTAANTATVKSRVDGLLINVPFKEGQLVKAGQVLAEIDPRPFQAVLAQAEGQLAKDEAQLANAKQDLARFETLLTQDSISRQQVDNQRAQVRQYQAAIKADQGQVASARLNLGFCRITAPISGRLGLRQVDVGNMIHASDANGLVTITQVQPINVLFTLPEDAIAKVAKPVNAGNKLAVDAYDREQQSKLASGQLLTIDNQIDTATGTVKLKAQFTNNDGGLFPNQFVNVRLLVDTLKSATLIPSAAVQRGTPGTYVYVVSTDKSVSIRPIKLGPADGDNVSVASGLRPGEVVVTDGADKLKDGAHVMLTSATQAGGASAPSSKRSGKSWHKKQASG